MQCNVIRLEEGDEVRRLKRTMLFAVDILAATTRMDTQGTGMPMWMWGLTKSDMITNQYRSIRGAMGVGCDKYQTIAQRTYVGMRRGRKKSVRYIVTRKKQGQMQNGYKKYGV